MKNEWFISIIAAGSALLGSLIPTIIGYFISVRQNKFELDKTILENKFELDKTLLEKQKDIYWDLMISLQNIINNTNNEATIELQKSVIKVSIYGDNKSALSLNNYFREIVKSSNRERVLLTKAEHQQFQKEIINGMRKNLGLEPFENFEIVAFRPVK
jgi:hypothetical protein